MAEKYKAQQMIDAIVEAKGILTEAAKKLGCSRQTLYNYMKRYTTVKEAYNEANEKNKDFVEGKLMDAIDKGNVTAMIFFLKTKAKDRGYIERRNYQNVNVNLSDLTNEQLEQISKGEDLLNVLSGSS